MKKHGKRDPLRKVSKDDALRKKLHPFQKAIQQVNLAEQGKIKLKSAESLLNEL